MNRRNTLGTALVVLALVLFAAPAIFPVQSMLVHDTRDTVTASPAELAEDDHEVLAYENLSERGRELYVKTLENDGEYRVPVGEGAAEFRYPNETERRQAYQGGDRSIVRPLVIERPADDSELPPSDERYFGPGPEEENASGEERAQHEATVQRYDAMDTATEEPPLGATPQLLRLASVLLAVLSLGVGGYLLSSK